MHRTQPCGCTMQTAPEKGSGLSRRQKNTEDEVDGNTTEKTEVFLAFSLYAWSIFRLRRVDALRRELTDKSATGSTLPLKENQ